MKKILAVIIAILVMLSFASCGKTNGTNETQNNETTAANNQKTTLSKEEIERNNKAILARIGFEEIMNYINMSEAYNVTVPISEKETIGELVEYFEKDGGIIEVHNIKTDTVFFDFAKENPDYAEGTGKYVLREDVDWLSIYTD